VPTAPPTKVPGKKDGETSDDALTRMSAAIKTLQGKYNAEVPGLMKENSRLVKENADLQSEHDKVKADNERLTREFDDFKKQSAQDQPKASAITDKEKEVATKLGIESDDFLALKNVILSGIPKPVEVKHEPTPKTVEKPVKESTLDQMTPAKRTYIETLDSLIGGWEVREEIVKDPKFAEFLSMFDGNSNKPIHELAREADDSLNSVRMAEVYTAFLDWKSAPPVSETKTPTSQLMPNPKGGGGDLKSNKKPIYTEQQYDDFQRAIKRGDYRTIGLNAEEAKKVIEAKAYWSEEFRTAKMEGRIVASQE
jgi:regulator of replication initiation timing